MLLQSWLLDSYAHLLERAKSLLPCLFPLQQSGGDFAQAPVTVEEFADHGASSSQKEEEEEEAKEEEEEAR